MIDQSNLENKQREMRTRHNKPRRGRVPKQRQAPAINMGQYRRRSSAYLLHERGWSTSQIAANFNVRIEAVEAWKSKGFPLIDL